jgi:hypothetical protein
VNDTREADEAKFREVVRAFLDKGLTVEQIVDVVNDAAVNEVMES